MTELLAPDAKPVFAGLRSDYSVIVADPPWLYQKAPGTKGANTGAPGIAEDQYKTMTNEQLAAMPVADLAAPDAHLFMWITNPGIYGGRFSNVTPADIAAAWGFEFKTLLTWVKTTKDGEPLRGGMGWYFRGCTEHILYAVRGKAGVAPARREPNLVMAQRGRHSEKPAEFHALVERVADGPYLEMFARAGRPGWDVFGDQAPTDGSVVERRPVQITRAEAAQYTGTLFGDLL